MTSYTQQKLKTAKTFFEFFDTKQVVPSYTINADDNTILAKMHPLNGTPDELKQVEALANLFAAAPELLARLEQAVMYMEHPSVRGTLEDCCKPISIMISQCKEAIKNAKGEV